MIKNKFRIAGFLILVSIILNLYFVYSLGEVLYYNENVYNQYGSYSLYNFWGLNKIADYYILNSRDDIDNGIIDMKVILYSKHKIFDSAKIKYLSGLESGADYTIYIEKNITVKYPIIDYLCQNITEYNNSINTFCHEEVKGYENKTKTIYEELNTSIYYDAGEYFLKVYVEKPMNSIVDFIPSVYGLDFDRWVWFNNSWLKKREIIIQENNNTDLYNYTILLNITYDDDMKNDFSDIRFINNYENGTLNYFIDNKTNGSHAYVWVKVPFIPANSQTTIYLYYGNSEAGYVGDPNSVFLLYDDFSGSSINSSKWTTYGSPSLTGSGELNFSGSGGSSLALRALNPFYYDSQTTGFELMTKYRFSSYSNYAGVGLGLSEGTNFNSGQFSYYPGYNFQVIENDFNTVVKQFDSSGALSDAISAIASTPGEASFMMLRRIGTYLNSYIKSNSGSFINNRSTINNNYITQGDNVYFYLSKNYDKNLYIDYIIVRKATNIEPTYTIGDESISNGIIIDLMEISGRNILNSNYALIYANISTIGETINLIELKLNNISIYNESIDGANHTDFYYNLSGLSDGEYSIVLNVYTQTLMSNDILNLIIDTTAPDGTPGISKYFSETISHKTRDIGSYDVLTFWNDGSLYDGGLLSNIFINASGTDYDFLTDGVINTGSKPGSLELLPLSFFNDNENLKQFKLLIQVNVSGVYPIYYRLENINMSGCDYSYFRINESGFFYSCYDQNDTKIKEESLNIADYETITELLFSPVSNNSLPFYYYDGLYRKSGQYVQGSVLHNSPYSNYQYSNLDFIFNYFNYSNVFYTNISYVVLDYAGNANLKSRLYKDFETGLGILYKINYSNNIIETKNNNISLFYYPKSSISLTSIKLYSNISSGAIIPYYHNTTSREIRFNNPINSVSMFNIFLTRNTEKYRIPHNIETEGVFYTGDFIQNYLLLKPFYIKSACNSSEREIVNMSFIDEMTKQILYNINGSVLFYYGVDSLIKVFNSPFNTLNNMSIKLCIDKDIAYLGDVRFYGQIDYLSDNYRKRTRYIYNSYLINNSTIPYNLSLYTIMTNTSEVLKVNSKTKTLDKINNKILVLYRFYPEINLYDIVEMSKTDDNGETALSVKLNDVEYKLGLYEENGSLIYLSNNLKFICLVYENCEYNLFVPSIYSSLNLNELLNIYSSLDYDSTNKILTWTYNDITQTTETIVLYVYYKAKNGESVTICNETIAISGSTTLSCNISGYINYYDIYAVGYKISSPMIPIDTKIFYKETTKFFNDTAGLIFQLFLSLSILLLSLFNPIIGIILFFISLVFNSVVFGSISSFTLTISSFLIGLILYLILRK